MMERYTIFLCGFGKRAQDHLAAISTSGRFDVVGICDTAVTAREATNRCGHMAVSQLADGLVRTQPHCPFRGHPPVPLAYLIDATGIRRVSCQVDTERMQVSAHFETKKLESSAWLIFIVSRWWEASRVGKDGRLWVGLSADSAFVRVQTCSRINSRSLAPDPIPGATN